MVTTLALAADMSTLDPRTNQALRQPGAATESQTPVLTQFKPVASSRDTRLLQLEQEVNELCQRQGEAARYPLQFEQNTQLTPAESAGVATSDSLALQAQAGQLIDILNTQLRESEQRYRTLFESLQEGYCVIEKVGGEAGEMLDFRYVETNPAFAAQTGLRDVLGKTLRQVLPDEFEERIRTYDAVHRTGESVRFQRDFVTHGRVLELYAFRVADKTQGRIGINLQDITGRKQAERLLRQNHDTFVNLIENAPFGLFVVDAQFCLRRVSTASRKVFSNIDPLIGRDFEEVLRLVWAEPFVSEAIGHFRHTLETGESYAAPNTTAQRQNIPEIESYDWKIERITLPDGQFGVVCYFYDITERMQAQAALRESEAFSRSIIKSSPNCIKVLDLAGNLLSMESGQELLGIEDIQPFLNKSWFDFWEGTDDKRAAQAAVASAAAGGAGAFVGFFRTLRGEPKWWDVAISPILDADGKPARLLAVSRDVTQRQQAEEVLRQHSAQFETLINEAPLGVVLIDADFRIRQMNPTALPTYGNLPELIGRDYAEVLHIFWPKAQADEAIQQFRHTLETGEPCFVPEMIERRADREAIEYYEWQISRIPLPDGRHGVVCYFRDISERVLAQHKIRDSEERYRGLFNSIDEGFAILEIIFDEEEQALDYRFLEVNPAFEKQTGILDALGKRMREISPDQPAPAIEIYSQVLLTGEPSRFVNEAKALGHYFDVYATRLGGPESRKVAVVFNNITERKAAEEALRESEGRFRALVLASSDLMCRMSPDWSEMRQIYDKNFVVETEVPNGNWLQHYVYQDDQPQLMAAVNEAIRTKSLFEMEHRVRRADGSWGWMLSRAVPLLDAKGEIVEWFGTGSDVTEKKRAEQALRDSEERLRLAADAAHFGTYDRDLGGGYFHISTQIKQMLGYEPDAPLDHAQVMSHFHPDDQRAGLAALKRACDPAGDGRIAVEQRIVRRDGAVRWISSVGRVLFENGVPKRSIGFWVDITERKLLEQETLAQAQTLTELDRRKDEFLAMLGHELRNPLAALSNAVQLLRVQKHEEPRQKQGRSIIERQVKQLTHLVDDLLEVSRINTGSLRLRQQQVSLRKVVERALETVQPMIAEQHHELTVRFSSTPIYLYADGSRLEQVLVNLLSNAAKYTPKGGRIELTIDEDDGQVAICVRDNGIGIAPDLLPHIFELFTQAECSLDRSQGGLGIGLSLVQRLVELHGGSVVAHSKPGRGSEFVVRLPLMQAAVPTANAPVAEIAAAQSGGLHIMVVDDNVDAAESLAVLLEMTGHSVRLAYDGPSALEAVMAYRPDVLLLDIGLPGLDGFEVAQRIRRQSALNQVTLVALTGYGQDSDRQRAFDAGFDYHLVKPADFGEIEKILAMVKPGVR